MKIYRLILSAIFTLIICAGNVTFAAESANDLIAKIERDTYGMEQEGALLPRLNRLEKDYSGRNLQEDLNTRIEALYTILYDNSATPSIIAKINAMEWNVEHQVKGGSVENRIRYLEKIILGTETEGTLTDRIRELVKASFSNENIPMYEIQLPADTLIKVALVNEISTRTAQVGDTVKFKILEDVIIDDNLVFAKGLYGVGIVDTVNKPDGWGSNGKLIINFNKVSCIDGQEVETFVDLEAKEMMIAEKMVRGAALVGLNINDDWNKVFVHGKNLEVPADTEFYIQTKNNSAVYALKGGRGSLTINTSKDTGTIDDDIFFSDYE